MGNDPWKCDVGTRGEKSGRTSPEKSKLPAKGMDSNGELGRVIQFLLNSREFPFLVQNPECFHDVLQGYFKKG